MCFGNTQCGKVWGCILRKAPLQSYHCVRVDLLLDKALEGGLGQLGGVVPMAVWVDASQYESRGGEHRPLVGPMLRDAPRDRQAIDGEKFATSR